MKDLMGQAIWDYYHDENPEDLQTETSISELDELPVDYLFRDFEDMNDIEQKALQLSKGKFWILVPEPVHMQCIFRMMRILMLQLWIFLQNPSKFAG
jgi:hypothetical protein